MPRIPKLLHRAAIALTALVPLMGVLVPRVSHALQFTITVQLTDVSSDLLGTGLQPGDRIQATLSHGNCSDSGCIGFYSPSQTYGHYDEGFVLSLDVPLPGMEIVGDNLDSILFDDYVEILNDYLGYDQYRFWMHTPDNHPVVSPEPTSIGGDPIFGVESWFISSQLTLRDLDGSVFDDALIPLSLPPASRFEETSFSLALSATYDLDPDYNTASATVLQLAGFVVPEPAPGCLARVALLVLCVWSRRPGIRHARRSSPPDDAHEAGR